MGKFFGTNGIRGIFPEDFTLEFVHDMTLALGTYFGEGPILIGFDGRESSPTICKTVTLALNSIGIDCNVAGLVPTPCLEFAVKTMGYAGGIMITASHNPPQYNGIKPVARDGVEISREDELAVEDIYLKKGWIKNPRHQGTTREENRAVDAYVKGVVSWIDSKSIGSRNLKVVLDLGNGVQTVAAPSMCKTLHCKTFLINSEIDGSFPGRSSEPTLQNLSELSRSVLENNADVGIAFDGDGDRSIFCDNRGNILTGDKSALVLVRHLLKKNPDSTIVTCLNSSSSIESMADRYSSMVIRTRVGSVEVSRRMVSTGALIGFEENGGFMYGRHNPVRDGCMTLALMLELLASSNRSLYDEAADLPPSFTTKDNVQCPTENAFELISSLSKEFPDSDTTDGIKITIDSKNWVMIRSSGTEPIIRVYAEAQSREKLEDLMSEYLEKVRLLICKSLG